MDSLKMIFARSVGILQPTRLVGRVGSTFSWQEWISVSSNPIEMRFCFYLTLTKQIMPLHRPNRLRTSAICPRSPWKLIVVVRSLRSSRLDFLWSRVWSSLTRLTKLVDMSVPAYEMCIFSSHPETLELKGMRGVNRKVTLMKRWVVHIFAYFSLWVKNKLHQIRSFQHEKLYQDSNTEFK